MLPETGCYLWPRGAEALSQDRNGTQVHTHSYTHVVQVLLIQDKTY